jgi:hypothetical protein
MKKELIYTMWEVVTNKHVVRIEFYENDYLNMNEDEIDEAVSEKAVQLICDGDESVDSCMEKVEVIHFDYVIRDFSATPLHETAIFQE